MIFKIRLGCIGLLTIMLLPLNSNAEIDDGCMLCHKYPGMGRMDASINSDTNKVKRVLYINSNLYKKTYHGSIHCVSCHTAVTNIPHIDVDKVDCATNCHIIDPSSSKSFSHKKIVDDFNLSVHGRENTDTKYKEDLPVCKDCHSNKAYHVEYESQDKSMIFLKVCEECHESGEFTKHFYEHITYRATKRRSSKEVVKLCSTCHADKEMMEKHDLDSVIGFTNTFHAKALYYGNTDVPNCLNCHAPYQLGFSPHRIASKTNKLSPSNPDNKHKTCSQVGCHEGSVKSFSQGGLVHPSDEKINLLKLIKPQETDSKSVAQTRLQNTIIYWIEMFYKILITLVISGLAIHRLLDFYSVRRDQKSGGH